MDCGKSILFWKDGEVVEAADKGGCDEVVFFVCFHNVTHFFFVGNIAWYEFELYKDAVNVFLVFSDGAIGVENKGCKSGVIEDNCVIDVAVSGRENIDSGFFGFVSERGVEFEFGIGFEK